LFELRNIYLKMMNLKDRQIIGKINENGVFLEQLEQNPGKYLPDVSEQHLGGEVVQIDLNKPMKDVLATLNNYPIRTRISLTGTLIVARDIAHAKLKERLDRGEGI
jgi:fumarate hydratase, class I